MSEAKPIAWIGFPEDQPKPTYDLIYENATKLPGYRYTPIWLPKDHPSSVRERGGAELQ